ncbi:MAG TPA: response regulator [Bacteroidota bacterium]|nr:response regulator [Bacteroidota bacterium]
MPSSGCHKILIVEDEPLIGWSMANALGRAGYDAEVVDCGEDAVDKIRRGDYELVISEFCLPRMDGLDLAARLKKISRALPVILISANEDLSGADIDSVQGIDYLIDKPFNLNEIVTLVGDILDRSGSEPIQ